jgi:hypothetical protein
MTKSQQNEHAFSANGELSIYNLSHPRGAPQGMSSATLSILDLSPLFSAVSAHTHFADYFSQSATL